MTQETLPFWLAEALAREQPADPIPLGEHIEADIAIVGGGYTGLWSAIKLKQQDPALRVVILEQALCGSGASGRNGGCLLTWSTKYPSLRRLFGEQEATRLVQASEQAVFAIRDFCQHHGIEAQLRLDGTLYTATSPAQQGGMTPALAALEQAGISRWQSLPPEEVQARAGSKAHLAGHFSPAAGSVQPALLVRGLRRVALALGIVIHEQTPMTRLVHGARPLLETPLGSVGADKVILAINAWLPRQCRQFSRNLILVSSDMVITDPAPERLDALGLRDGISVVDGRTFVHYYRRTPAGRLMLGKGGNRFAFANRLHPWFDRPSAFAADLRRRLDGFFPSLADLPIAASWTGPSDRSATGLPFFGHLEDHPNVLYGAGYSGNGVVQSWMGGEILAALALDLDNEWRHCPLASGPRGQFPPEPIRWLGANLVRRAILRKEQAEDEGRPVPSWARHLARLADAAGKADKG